MKFILLINNKMPTSLIEWEIKHLRVWKQNKFLFSDILVFYREELPAPSNFLESVIVLSAPRLSHAVWESCKASL